MIHSGVHLKVPRAWCAQTAVDLDAPRVSAGSLAGVDLSYIDSECGIVAQPGGLFFGQTVGTTESISARECTEVVTRRPGFTPGRSPEKGLKLCVVTDRGNLAGFEVAGVDDEGNMELKVWAWRE